MDPQTYSSKNLDHLGLVAGMRREIGVSEVIDRYCYSEREDQIVPTGKALEAMILNGLGFVNKPFLGFSAINPLSGCSAPALKPNT